jgi:CRP-like cAMP-binding protein
MAESIQINALLRAVERPVLAAFDKRIRIVELRRNDSLYNFGADLDYVYFPLRGLVGIQAETADGEFVESALVGREGAIGAFEACGSRQYLAEAVVQVEGSAAQMSAASYRELFEASPNIRTAIHCYVEQLMSETRQFVVCNSLHPVEARLARILLEAADKSGIGRALPLTQQSLARMLGVQRTTIANIVSRLQKDGIVDGGRGVIEIADAVALEAVACSCRSSLQVTLDAIEAVKEPSCEAVIAAE